MACSNICVNCACCSRCACCACRAGCAACAGVANCVCCACGQLSGVTGTFCGTVCGNVNASGNVCAACFSGGCCNAGCLAVKCLVVKCKATLGATDPPWVLYDPNTREQVASDIVRQVPEEKQGGATLFYNKDTKQMEYYIHTENKYYKLISEEITQ